MPLRKTAGAILEIGGILPAQEEDMVAADFTGITWVRVGRVEDFGDMGDASEPITFDDVSLGRRQKMKGVRDAGTMEVVVGADPESTGQAALVAAERTPDDYAIRISWNDAVGAGAPTRRMFVAQVMSVRERLGTANNIIRMNVSLGINSNIIRVARAGGA